MTRNYVEFGIFPPAMHPQETPVETWNATPTLGIIINEAWIPYVVGTLKVMLRDAMWKNSLGSVYPTIEDVDALLASWRVVIDPGPETDWQINAVCQSVAPLVFKQVSGIPGAAGNYGWRTGIIYAEQQGALESAMDMHVTFGDLVSNTPSGVNIYDFEVAASFPTHLINVQFTDCLGGIHAATHLGTVSFADVFSGTPPIALKRIDITADTDNLDVMVKGADPIQCTVA